MFESPGGGTWSRRQFLKTSATLGIGAVAASVAWDGLFGRVALAAGPALPSLEELLPRERVRELLRIALSRGGDFAEVYGEYTMNTNLGVDQGKLATVEYGVLSGVGIRVLAGDQIGYAYADDYDAANLKRAAEVAAAIASGGAGTPRPFAVSTARPPFVLKTPAPLALSETRKIELALLADAAARGVDPRITQVTATWNDQAKRILVANSDGIYDGDDQFISRLTVQALATEPGKRNNGFASMGGQLEAGAYADAAIEETARTAARTAVTLLKAEEPKAGTYPVVIAPGWGGVLVHECFGHSLEGDGIRKKTSIRANQRGQQVAATMVNIVDDGTVPNGRGSFKVDDEGTPSRRNQVVKDGVLVGYLWDRLNHRFADKALSEGLTLTGNARRQSYREFPIPRMTNTYLEAGNASPESIIADVKDGIYCADMQGGSVNPADGSFSFACTLSYKIENGKLAAPVKNVTLAGNGADAMLRIDALGNDLKMERGRGSCGKQGQFKPVGVGQPTVRFTGFTVGGSRTS